MPGENIQDWSYNGGEQPCGANCTDAEIESTHTCRRSGKTRCGAS